MERPIVVVGERAAIGRPPENVLRLLGEHLLRRLERRTGSSVRDES